MSCKRLLAGAAVALGLSCLITVPATAAPAGIVDRPVATTGCGKPAPAGGTGHLTSGGVARDYLIHLPKGYDARRPYPLVLSFHGHGRTSAYQEELSGFSKLNAIAVYPQGVTGTDGESAWTSAPYSAPVDDVLFTSDLLTALQRRLCVDPGRIYAAGKSNGGGFVGVLACRLASRIAAFAPVSGAFYPQGGACAPSRRVPLIDFHGTADTTIPYGGNPAKGLPSIPDWLAAWASRDGCFPRPLEFSPVPHVLTRRWLGPGCSLTHFQIQHAGHVWPSTQPNLDSAKPGPIDATPIIWQFFRTHPLVVR